MKFFVTFTFFCVCTYEQTLGAITYQNAIKVSQMDDHNHLKNALHNLLVPRVVGTEGWKNVQNFIVDDMKSMGMEVELDSFVDETPIFGKLNFVNIIGKLNPSADRFLVLSAHYDSKYFPEGDFIGATDSAVPCALMLNIVKTALPVVQKMLQDKNLGLMLVFFDGEEAFQEWSSTDSIYGSRHLARKWEQTSFKNEREIDRINVLVLLDLIGAGNERFVCTFRNTCPLNTRLWQIENTLQSASSLRRLPNSPANNFLKSFKRSGVSDDHEPFLNRGVPILHLIPTYFPRTWHTPADNGQNLDLNSIDNLNKILRVFVVDYISTCANNPKSSTCAFK